MRVYTFLAFGPDGLTFSQASTVAELRKPLIAAVPRRDDELALLEGAEGLGASAFHELGRAGAVAGFFAALDIDPPETDPAKVTVFGGLDAVLPEVVVRPLTAPAPG